MNPTQEFEYARKDGDGTGRMTVLRTVPGAQPAPDWRPEELTMGDVLERSGASVVRVDGMALLLSMNWAGRLQVLGAMPHCEAVVWLPVLPAAKLAQCVDPEAPPEFWRAVFLLLCADQGEADIRARGWVTNHWLRRVLAVTPE